MMQRGFTRSLATGQIDDGTGTMLPLAPALGAAAIGEQENCQEVVYDLSSVACDFLHGAPDASGLEKWAPLLPPLVAGRSLGEGQTPLFPVRLPGMEGRDVIVKDEGRNPTGTHKDRLARCITNGVAWAGGRGIVAASSGNHALATAAYASSVGLPCVAVITEGVPTSLSESLRAYGATVIETERDERWRITREVVQQEGFASATNLSSHAHVGHPFGIEGYKTIAYEIVAEVGVPGVVACPIGYGELMAGIAKGFAELHEVGIIPAMPTILGCETASRPALSHAIAMPTWNPVEVDSNPTLATSIATTVPGYRAWRAVRDHQCKIVTVTESEIVAAYTALAHAGVFIESSSAAAFAGLAKAASTLSSELDRGPAVVVNTSTGYRNFLLSN